MKKWPMLMFVAACTFALIGSVMFVGVSAGETTDSESVSGTSLDLPEDCQVHVIGIYSAENSNQDDRVYVKVKDTGKPVVIVLCSYFGVQWNMEVEPNAQVKQIILSGWFESSIVNIPEGTPVMKIIGSSGDPNKPQKKYFWAYAWHTEQGRAMVEQVEALTGRSITTFQGAYGGLRFTIDGKLGENPGLTTESEQSETDPESTPLTPEQLSNPAMVEQFVRKSFQLDMDAKLKRINEAEAELTRIKAKFAKRQASAEQLIQERIAALVLVESSQKPLGGGTTVEPKSEPILDPTGKGWRAWQTQDYDLALRMFEIAVRNEPNNGAAWNGLGWTHLHLAQIELAKEAFEKALVIEPRNGGARNGLGRIFRSLGRLDDAEKELLRATQELIDEYGEDLVVEQGMTAPWFGLIEVKLSKKDFTGAKEWAERYLKQKPDDAQMLHLLKKAQSETP